MKQHLALPLVAVLALAAPAAQAAVIGTYTHDYAAGLYDPPGTGTQTAQGVVVSEADAVRFRDRFDFSDLAGRAIERLTLSVSFSEAGPGKRRIDFFGLQFDIPTERWYLDIAPDRGFPFADAAAVLRDTDGPLTRSIDAGTDAARGESTFADAVDQMGLDFGFQDLIFYQQNDFVLESATLTVEGQPATVPLPAPFWMLLSGLGALAWRGRRQT
ncbi:MAG: VPLPA-CTERM sorting domain-containing protein [Pseudomonadota bacterium]